MKDLDQDNTKAFFKLIGCKVDITSTGSPDWYRWFIIRSDGCTIGRVNWHKGKFYNVKNYKKSHWEGVDETDLVWMRFDKWAMTGYIMPEPTFWMLAEKAEQIREEDMLQKQIWRRNNPKKGRKKLQGRNVRHILDRLVYYFSEVNDYEEKVRCEIGLSAAQESEQTEHESSDATS